jgi:hypothetical protein
MFSNHFLLFMSPPASRKAASVNYTNLAIYATFFGKSCCAENGRIPAAAKIWLENGKYGGVWTGSPLVTWREE